VTETGALGEARNRGVGASDLYATRKEVGQSGRGRGSVRDLRDLEEVLRRSPTTSSIYILYIRPLQFSLKDFISYIYFLSNNII
jgi:hypothetical protein